MGKQTVTTELEVSRLITKLQWKLYSESGFTLVEVGSIFKITAERVRQRLEKGGYKLRKQNHGAKPRVPIWQKNYISRLVSYGLIVKDASSIIGINYKEKLERGRLLAGRGKLFNKYKSSLLNVVWSEFVSLLVEKMWNDDATMQEISEIIGYKNKNVLGVKMIRMRKSGVNLTKRRTNKK